LRNAFVRFDNVSFRAFIDDASRGRTYTKARRAPGMASLISDVRCPLWMDGGYAAVRAISFVDVADRREGSGVDPGGRGGRLPPPPNKNIPGREYLFAPSKF